MRKLKASGFRDIERSEDQLRSYSYEVVRMYDPFVASYFDKALSFLNSHTFETDLDRFVWQLHSEGHSCREISSILEKSKSHRPLSKSGVLGRIRALEDIMLKTAV